MFQQNFHPSQIQSQVPFQGLHHFYDVDVHLSFMFLKKFFSFITLQSAIQKYYITFQNADVIY
jgi:hypothetical protein